MTDFIDKRSDARIAFQTAIPIRISYFNSEQFVEGILLDHCVDGMCFLSSRAFYQGAPVLFRVSYHHVDADCNCDLDRLPSMRIGEVKWCSPHPNETMPMYRTGIKYY